ncbi:right-handed parallel beta-helix repeat-containing protein [Prosthecobacter sp. SYSU 5D2]|uniref:right-handed parallel beta-helix repeat-containing protein n=1 Tax=Prosthecobacter sp. SYSU 5D2 TaxID=3134134 RepID=UPI0031FEAFA2
MKISFLPLCVFFGLCQVLPAAVTLRSLGATGDGTTDDRRALEAAFAKSAGQPVDGEGLTYAVRGSVQVRTGVDLRNATIRQTLTGLDTTKWLRSAGNTLTPEVTPPDALRSMVNGVPLMRHDGVATYAEDPVVTGAELEAMREMLNIRTLFIYGEVGKPVPVKLEKVKILMGEDAEAGMHSNSAAVFIRYASPVTLKDVEVTGKGKGAGMFIHACQKVRMDGVYIHDLLWAPYRGDVAFSAEVLGRDFGWNNSPIYDFDERAGRFIRVRVQEQLTGLTLGDCANVEILNTRVERIGSIVDGEFLPWQADAMTISGVKGLVMRDCEISQAWEGIDFTGQGVDGFIQENIHIRDTFAYGFKYAHPQKNGKVINCTSERADYRSFTIGAECENIEFINCAALETGLHGRWVREGRARNGIAGFDLSFDEGHSPRNITLRDCRAENVAYPKTMEVGFSTSDRAQKAELNIRLINPTVIGATLREVDGFKVEQ